MVLWMDGEGWRMEKEAAFWRLIALQNGMECPSRRTYRCIRMCAFSFLLYYFEMSWTYGCMDVNVGEKRWKTRPSLLASSACLGLEP
ncbi:unnamed protein product [Boreogadus saida]